VIIAYLSTLSKTEIGANRLFPLIKMVKPFILSGLFYIAHISGI